MCCLGGRQPTFLMLVLCPSTDLHGSCFVAAWRHKVCPRLHTRVCHVRNKEMSGSVLDVFTVGDLLASGQLTRRNNVRTARDIHDTRSPFTGNSSVRVETSLAPVCQRMSAMLGRSLVDGASTSASTAWSTLSHARPT